MNINIPLLSGLLATLKRWQHRRMAIDYLNKLNDHMLKDIGIERTDILATVEDRLKAECANSGEQPVAVQRGAARYIPNATSV